MPRQCPKCKTSDYNNRTFCLMINECGHSLCRNCVDNIFARHQAPCPACGKTLRKQTFWVQTFDDPQIEREVYWRKKLKKIYNLQEDDFPTLRAYNDYLEEFEDVVHNLANDIDVAKTQARVMLFKEQNKTKIEANQSRKTDDELFILSSLEEEKVAEARARESLQHDVNELKKKMQEKDAAINQKSILDELIKSDAPATLVIDRQRREAMRAEDRKTTAAQQEMKRRLAPTKTAHRVTPYVPCYPSTAISSAVPERLREIHIPEMASLGAFVLEMRECTPEQLAGGFTRDLVAQRAICESLTGLGVSFANKSDRSQRDLAAMRSKLPRIFATLDESSIE